MDLIPAIDLMNGKCVRLFKGDFNKRKDFTKEPHEQAKFWESEGAKYIHLVDLDAAKTGSPTNDKSIKKLRENNYIVEEVLSIVDRQEGGLEALEDENVKLKSLFTIKDFL